MFEYPVLAFPLLLIPRLLTSDFDSYRFAFVVEMILFDVAAIVLIARHGGETEEVRTVARRLAWYTLYCVLLAPLMIGLYDLAPTVLAFAAARWWFSGRNIAGGIAAGLGTLMKIFPGVAAAPALVWEASQVRTTRARGMAAFLGTLAAGVAAWFWLGGSRAVESLGYHNQRGLEVESLYGGALFLVGTIAGTKVPWVNNYNAFHVVPEWGARLALFAFPLQAAALLVVMWRCRRSGMADGLRYSAAAVLAFIVFCKVLSPQYLIWPCPFMAALDGRTGEHGTENLPSRLRNHGDVLPRTRLCHGPRAPSWGDRAPESPEHALALAPGSAAVRSEGGAGHPGDGRCRSEV